MGIGFRGMKNSTMLYSTYPATSQPKSSYHQSTTLTYNKNSKLTSQKNAWFTSSSSSSASSNRFGTNSTSSSHHYNLRTRVKKLVR